MERNTKKRENKRKREGIKKGKECKNKVSEVLNEGVR